MLVAFSVGALLVAACAIWTLRKTKNRHKIVLILANGLPAARIEAGLRLFAWRLPAGCCWYVYAPQCAGSERLRILYLLSRRLGFSLLSAGEYHRLHSEKGCQFYFLTAAGVFYRLNSPDSSGSL